METKNYQSTKEYYNKVAEYRATTFLQGWVGEIAKRRVLPAINVLIFDKNKKEKWLDMGCASGFNLDLGIKFNNPDADIYGIDIAENNIKLAKQRLKKHNPNLQLGNVENLPFKNNMFDKVTYLHVIEHVVNPVKSLKELKRVLNDNGVACISFQNKYGLETFLFDLTKKIVGYNKTKFGDTGGFNKGKKVLDKRRSIWEIKKMCDDVGLKIKRVDGCIVMLPSLAWRIPGIRKLTLFFSDILQTLPIIKYLSSYINVTVVKE